MRTEEFAQTALPIVAIVGRPNVGKSTLFNRLCRERRALVDRDPGITRDRITAQISWEDRAFWLVDTGGMVTLEDGGAGSIQTQVHRQAEIAVEEADVVLFLADGKEGLHPEDVPVADLLRRSSKPAFYAVNKIDGLEQEPAAYEFYRLGVERVFPISAAHGYGVRDLMDALVEVLPAAEEGPEPVAGIRVAIVGRPNVGKSSLINRLLGAERVLVSEIPGTTRDIVDVNLRTGDRSYVLVDTPGIRRRSKTREKIEKFSVLKALRSIERCQVAVLLVDASRGITSQDVRIAGYIHERGCGAVVLINKWDLLGTDTRKMKEIKHSAAEALKFMPYAPILRISALTGKRVSQLLPTIDTVFDQYSTRVPTSTVNQVLDQAVARHEAPGHGKRKLKFFYATQVGIRPPTFVFFVNRPQDVHFSYQRYLANRIRKAFSLDRTPVRLLFRGREGGRRKRRR